MAKRKIETRKLNDTSWLAQTIQDKMDIEINENGITSKWNCLNTLHIIVNEADDINNDKIYYGDTKNQIIISEIPSLMKHGSDFSTEGMQNKLRGLAERYKDDEGNYIVHVRTTLDLNTATINDISELMYQMN